MPALFIVALSLAAAQQLPSPPVDQPRRYSRPFVSPMGEPFEGKDALDQWFHRADANGDATLSPAELKADAGRFFAFLDSTHDGEIDPEDVQRYESVIAPFIHVGPGGPGPGARFADRGNSHRGEASDRNGGGDHDGDAHSDSDTPKVIEPARQGAGWFGMLNIAEPVTSADTNLDRGVSLAEFERAAANRFQLLDTNHDGQLLMPELKALLR